MKDIIAYYFGITFIIFIILMLSDKIDFIISYFDIKEWKIKHIIFSPIIPAILLITLLTIITESVGYIIKKLNPILNKKLFK